MKGLSLHHALAASAALLMLAALPAHAGPGSEYHAFPSGGGFLGVMVQDVTDELREALELDDEEGVLVNRVHDGTPADEAGIEVGDVLHSIDGTALRSAGKLSRLVRAMEPGQEADIELTRDGKKRSVTAEIGVRGEGTGGTARVAIGHEPGPWLGVRLHDPDADLAAYFETEPDGGALVLHVEEESPAAEAELRGGDVILRIGDDEIDDSADAVAAIARAEAGDEVTIRFLRKGKEKEVDVTLAESPRMHWFDKAGVIDLRSLPSPHRFDGKVGKFPAGNDDLREEMEVLREEMDELRRELRNLKRGD